MTTATRDIEDIYIDTGGHRTSEEGMCLMEAVAYVAGETHSWRPQCACLVLTEYAANLNDAIKNDDLRNRLLKPLIPKLVNSRVESPEVLTARATHITRGVVIIVLREILRSHRDANGVDTLRRVEANPSCSLKELFEALKAFHYFQWFSAIGSLRRGVKALNDVFPIPTVTLEAGDPGRIRMFGGFEKLVWSVQVMQPTEDDPDRMWTAMADLLREAMEIKG